VALRHAFETPAAKRHYNRELFGTIAHRYDLITRLLSYGQDAQWKARLIGEARIIRGERVIDLACGSGDLAFGVAARGARAVGLDLTRPMLDVATGRARAAGSARVPFVQGDMASLPFPDAAFDVATTGYGLRNVPDLSVALNEIARVLKPGGRFLSLDFNHPRSAVVRLFYLGYLEVVGSLLGWCLHRDPDTYRYIPASLRRYPGAEGVASALRASGFASVRIIPLLSGLMSLHVARRND
jgi:demethylmenaquinone methyltransferase/2-methoxy-6-polyprenyl-1,4-benzoquinol methylase